MAVHDLGEEIALDAVEAAIDLRLDVAMGGDDAVLLGGDHDAAARPAEPARRLVPFELGYRAFGDEVRRHRRSGHAACQGRRCGGLHLENLTAIGLCSGHEDSFAETGQAASTA